ncbi:unnamed protein product [Ectocarpus sp. CCAP 1310/34]|nr:unnamed protein product [Ectocarpus sp. CCAP 1310/34]
MMSFVLSSFFDPGSIVCIPVAISRRVQRYKLALRGRQDAENRRTRSTSDQSTPMIWGWSVDAS